MFNEIEFEKYQNEFKNLTTNEIRKILDFMYSYSFIAYEYFNNKKLKGCLIV